ncbi:MAG: TDT family transporter [Vibrionaceae bacterium]
MKRYINTFPTPMAGLALALAGLGWSWENAAPLGGVGQVLGAVIAAALLLVIGTKFTLNPRGLWEDLKHPVVGSTVPTFAMALMMISASLGKLSLWLGDGLWLLAVGLHLCFFFSFAYHRAKEFSLSHMVPSWFVPPIGIVVANVAFSGNPALEPIATFTLAFGLLMYALLLPLMLFRLIFLGEVHDSAKTTLAILAAPASLNLAGYLTTSTELSPVIINLLFGIAILMTAVIYLSFVRLLRLPFSPGYAAFTFPMVISATAQFKMAGWMASHGFDARYVEQVRLIAHVELFIATAVVLYVAWMYRKFLATQWTNVT